MNSCSTCGSLAPSAVLNDLLNVFPSPQPFPTSVPTTAIRYSTGTAPSNGP